MSKSAKPICGIIMPISASDEVHTEAHWLGVKSILTRAIELADCHPQPVWEKGEYDIIQARILKNIFDNEIVVCDVSTRNPNVMLEWGMRLTTKKPTIVVAEKGTTLPFDTSIIHTEFYDPSLEWSSAQLFIEKVAMLLDETLKAVRGGIYHPYLEAFKFETVEPEVVSVSAEERMESMFGELATRLGRIEARLPATLRASGALSNYTHGAGHIGPDSNATPLFGIGDRVFHAKFGEGVVSDVVGNKVEAEFSLGGRRRVIDSFLEPFPPF